MRGELRPGGTEREWCDPDVLRRLRRASLAALRKEVEPVEQTAYARFLPSWHGIDRRATLREALVPLQALAACRSRSGRREVLPRRVPGLPARAARPALRDRRGRLGRRRSRPRRRLLPRGRRGCSAVRPARRRPEGEAARRDPRRARPLGALFWLDLLAETGLDAEEALPALWDLVWAGEVTNDAWQPLRAPRRYGVPKPERRPRRFSRRRAAAITATQGRWSLDRAALRRHARPARARRAPARAAGHRHARRRPRRGDPRRLRRGLRRSCARSRRSASAAAATSSRASAARSSRSAARSSGCASCARARARSPRRSCSPPPIPPSRTAPRCPGRSGPARARPGCGRARRAPRRRGGAVRRARRPLARPAARARTTTWLRPALAALVEHARSTASGGSRSSGSTASRSPSRRPCRCSSRPASSPARGAPCSAPRRAGASIQPKTACRQVAWTNARPLISSRSPGSPRAGW